MKSPNIVMFTSVFLLSFGCFQKGYAQADLDDLFDAYIAKPQSEQNSSVRLTEKIAGAKYWHISLNEPAAQQLKQLIKEGNQDQVKSLFFVVSDTTDLETTFGLLQQFPNLESLNFYDDGESSIKRNYQLPEAILKFKNLKVIKINGGQNLDVNDTFRKLYKLPKLVGVDLLDYKAHYLPVCLDFLR